MMTRPFIPIASLFLLLLMPAGAWCASPKNSARPPVAAFPCEREMQSVLESWNVTGPWITEPPEKGQLVYASPTDRIGIWAEVRQARDGKVALYRLSPGTTVKAEFSSTCSPTVNVTAAKIDEKRLKRVFTDAELERILAQHQAGMIYSWSPGIPVSMRAIATARKAAAAAKIPFFLVLDPSASDDAASRARRPNGLDAAAMKKMESLELLYRGMAAQYPSVQLFSKGKLVGPVFSGVKPETAYADLIRKHIFR